MALRMTGTEPTTARRRLDSIQMMRGAAATLVVFAHAVDLVQAHPKFGVSHIAGLGALENVGAIGVDLFFIISGFVMALSVTQLSGTAAARRFLTLRWARIAPPFLIACGLFICVQTFFGTPHPLPWRALANAVLFVPVVDGVGYTVPVLDVGWTLSFEFTFYLGVAALVLLGLSRRPEVLALGIVLAVALGMATDPQNFLLRWMTNPIMLEFVLGIVAYRLWETGLLNRFRPLQWVLGAGAAAVLVAETVVGFGTVSEAWAVLDASGSADRVLLWGLPLFFVFVALLPYGQGQASAPGVFARGLGDSSYSLYLVHPLVFLFLSAVYLRVPAIPLPLADVVLLFSVAVAVLVGFAFHRWVETPINERVRRSAVASPAPATRTRKRTTTPAPAAVEPITEQLPQVSGVRGPSRQVPPPRPRQVPSHPSRPASTASTRYERAPELPVH